MDAGVALHCRMLVIIKLRKFFITGKGKGTPALKDGIKCFKVDSDEDSDTHSDWQGF